MPVVRRIVRESEASNYRFSDLLMRIVESEPFLMRTKEGAEQNVVVAGQ
jgi:hypothetical protein